jgi:methyl-accepting chemotaxis protein
MSRELVLKALAVAALVGTILLVINQYDALFGNEPIRIIPAVLTYIVPFIVFLAGNLSKSRR